MYNQAINQGQNVRWTDFLTVKRKKEKVRNSVTKIVPLVDNIRTFKSASKSAQPLKKNRGEDKSAQMSTFNLTQNIVDIIRKNEYNRGTESM